MHSAQELLTRWPSLDTAARHARLKNTLEIAPGPLAEIIQTHVGAAAQSIDLSRVASLGTTTASGRTNGR
jgi:hypothetical protein